jgi:hypothetical protein
MGYPIHYHRVICRNRLEGDYAPAADDHLSIIRGDLRRLETDTLDDQHVAAYAALSGATEEQVRKILGTFFYGCICPLSAEPMRVVHSETPGYGIMHGWTRVESYKERV